MTEIKLKKRYPQSRTEDITDAFMRGYEQGKKDGLKVGKQIVLGAFETYITADRKTEPQTGRVMLDGYKLIMSLNDWWYSSFGYEETEESKAIKKVIDKVEKYVEQAEQTEPQTEIKVEPTWVGTTYGRFEDEPQTDCSWK